MLQLNNVKLDLVTKMINWNDVVIGVHQFEEHTGEWSDFREQRASPPGVGRMHQLQGARSEDSSCC